MKSVPATRSIFERSACIAGVDPMSGAAPSRRGFDPDKPARASRLRPRSISSTSAPRWRRHAQHLKIPLAQPAARIEPRFQDALRRRVAPGTSSEIDSALPLPSGRASQRLVLSRSCTECTGTRRRSDSSNAPRISATSPRLSSVRVSDASSSPNASRRSRRRGRYSTSAAERDAVMM